MQFLVYVFLVTWPFFIESHHSKLLLEGSGGIPKLDITRVFCILFILIVGIYKLLVRKNIKTDIIVLTTILYLIYFFLEIVLNDVGVPISTAFAGMFQLTVIPCIIYFTLINLENLFDKKYLIYAVLLSGVLISGVGVLEFFMGHNVMGPENLLADDQASNLYRTNGPFWDVIGYAGIVISFVPFAYWCLKEKLVEKWFAWFCLILFSAGALVNISRIIWIVFAIMCAIFCFSKRVKMLLLIFFGLISIGVCAYFLGDYFVTSKIYHNRFAQVQNVTGRYEQYTDAMKQIWDSPFFGKGYEMYRKTHNLALHNSFLKMVVDFGFVGLIFYIPSILALLLFKFGIYIKSPCQAKAKTCLILVVLLVPMTIDFLGNSPFVIAFYILTAVTNMQLDSKGSARIER